MRMAAIILLISGLPFLPSSADAREAEPQQRTTLSSADMIVENIEGRWALWPRQSGSDDLPYKCGETELLIWLERDGKAVTYRSTFVSADGSGDDFVERSDVRVRRYPNGETMPLLVIQYDGEERLTAAGEPVTWYLYMLGPDVHFWGRADWSPLETTTKWVRCKESANIS